MCKVRSPDLATGGSDLTQYFHPATVKAQDI